MKISKLFHWLYAILMFLPIMVFIPNAFYYGFNKEAIAQEKTEQVPVYYDTNNVNSVDDLVVGNIYTITYNNFNNNNNECNIGCDDIIIIDLGSYIYGTANQFMQIPYIRFNTTNDITIALERSSSTAVYRYLTTNCTIDFIYSYHTGNISYYLSLISQCERQYIKEYQPLTTSMSITDSMSYAWDSVWQNDLFSWSYGSFLTEPFIYIGNVFNVPVDNSLYYALSYWLDISIIWLCFDVIMYVPLLVHRWLDKGIVE